MPAGAGGSDQGKASILRLSPQMGQQQEAQLRQGHFGPGGPCWSALQLKSLVLYGCGSYCGADLPGNSEVVNVGWRHLLPEGHTQLPPGGNPVSGMLTDYQPILFWKSVKTDFWKVEFFF